MKATCEFVWNKKTYPAGCDVTGLDMEDQAALEAAGLIGTLSTPGKDIRGERPSPPKMERKEKVTVHIKKTPRRKQPNLSPEEYE